MAKRKFEIISEMFDRVSTEVTSSPDKWRSFLNSACRNFKLRYDEQILVYAQKPEATAVLPIERWNRTFGRWVNRGAKGIARIQDRFRYGICAPNTRARSLIRLKTPLAI